MSSLQRFSAILFLASELKGNNSWCGETHIQKSLYIFSNLCHADLGFTFTLYKHGPYSFDFHDTLSELQALSLFDLKYDPPYGPKYIVNDRGYAVINSQKAFWERYRAGMIITAKCVGSKNVRELEKISTALYLWKESPTLGPEGRAQRLSELKPHIHLEEARQATFSFERDILPCFMAYNNISDQRS